LEQKKPKTKGCKGMGFWRKRIKVLYNIVFQDNIYILLRQIDTINNGLRLELDARLFEEKMFLDLAFFDKAIKQLFSEISKQTSLPNFIDVLQCLHFCISKYVELLTCISSRSFASKWKDSHLEVQNIKKEHQHLLETIEAHIRENDMQASEQEMVSKNELAELLQA